MCLCVSVHVCVCVHIYAYVHVCACLSGVNTCVRGSAYVHVRACVCVTLCVCVWACVCVCLCVTACACVIACTRLCVLWNATYGKISPSSAARECVRSLVCVSKGHAGTRVRSLHAHACTCTMHHAPCTMRVSGSQTFQTSCLHVHHAPCVWAAVKPPEPQKCQSCSNKKKGMG